LVAGFFAGAGLVVVFREEAPTLLPTAARRPGGRGGSAANVVAGVYRRVVEVDLEV